MFQLFKHDSQASDKKFWNWFIEHQDELYMLKDDQNHTFEILSRELSKIHPGLSFEFGPIIEKRREFTISAGGSHEVFPIVERLYTAKPSLERWTIKKFKQRKDLSDLELSIGERTFSGQNIFYRLYDDSGKIGIALYIEGLSSEEYDMFSQVGFIFLDAALGEYDMETKVGSIDFFGVDAVDFKDAQPLIKLPTAFDGFRHNK